MIPAPRTWTNEDLLALPEAPAVLARLLDATPAEWDEQHRQEHAELVAVLTLRVRRVAQERGF
ncbi:MAG TPA: hypothetical protein VHD91_12565 [Gaiellaceae bacterium]|nr:hypothetical protein [Gaiellaceae bacterium]